MLREARTVAAEYPDIRFFEANVDAMCMWLIKNPYDYDVLVAENLLATSFPTWLPSWSAVQTLPVPVTSEQLCPLRTNPWFSSQIYRSL